MPSAPVNRVAWGRYLCFASDRRGRLRFRFGTKMMMCRPGWGPRERTPTMAASAAASVQSWLARMPRSMHVPSAKAFELASQDCHDHVSCRRATYEPRDDNDDALVLLWLLVRCLMVIAEYRFEYYTRYVSCIPFTYIYFYLLDYTIPTHLPALIHTTLALHCRMPLTSPPARVNPYVTSVQLAHGERQKERDELNFAQGT